MALRMPILMRLIAAGMYRCVEPKLASNGFGWRLGGPVSQGGRTNARGRSSFNAAAACRRQSPTSGPLDHDPQSIVPELFSDQVIRSERTVDERPWAGSMWMESL